MARQPHIVRKFAEYVKAYNELNDDYVKNREQFKKELVGTISRNFRITKQDTRKTLKELKL